MQVKSYVSRLIDPRKIRRKKHRDDQEIDEQRNGSHCKRGEESRQHLYVHARLSGNARAYLHVITTQTLKETRPRSSQHCKQGQYIEKHRRRQWRVRAHNNPVTEAAFTCLTEIIFGLHANAVTKRKKVVALFFQICPRLQRGSYCNCDRNQESKDKSWTSNRFRQFVSCELLVHTSSSPFRPRKPEGSHFKQLCGKLVEMPDAVGAPYANNSAVARLRPCSQSRRRSPVLTDEVIHFPLSLVIRTIRSLSTIHAAATACVIRTVCI